RLRTSAGARDVESISLNGLPAGTYYLRVAGYDPKLLSQWATSVLSFSSQFGTDQWSAAQALGAPDTPQYGDYPTAWAPSRANGSYEKISLGFPTPVYAFGVVVRETFGNGFINSATFLRPDGTREGYLAGGGYYSDTDPTRPGLAEDNLMVNPYKTDNLVN